MTALLPQSVDTVRMARPADSPNFISKRRRKRKDKRDAIHSLKAYEAPDQPGMWCALCPNCWRWHTFPEGNDGDPFDCPNPGDRSPKALRLNFFGVLPTILKAAYRNNRT